MGYANTHIHTPYSFSAFDSIDQAIKQAKEECICALGISDFNTVDGFREFSTTCEQKNIYPLFNIEFITLCKDDRKKKLRWNDPSNPGIMYFCGKALSNPVPLGKDSKNLLAALWKGSQDHVWQVILSLNEHLDEVGLPIRLDYCSIRSEFAKNTVGEQHVAKALYVAFVMKWQNHNALLNSFRSLFRDPTFSNDLFDAVVMQHEIRDRLMKPGKAAYIEGNAAQLLTLDTIKSLIIEAGGIPCYPVLADDAIGLTEYEQDVDKLADRLHDMDIHAVEFIPQHTTLGHLKRYVVRLHERGFNVTLGTEHNTPAMLSLRPLARGKQPLDDELERIAYEGACVFAAHQELRRQNRTGFIDELGKRTVSPKRLRDFVRIGEEAVRKAGLKKHAVAAGIEGECS